jgi:hypothetical protein
MDLNGLISTITTSTAALVAIIGGFLVSRVISLSSEQTGIKRKVREVKNDLMAKKELLQNVENYLLYDDAKQFLKDNILKILKKESLSIIINKDKRNYRSEEELNPFFKDMEDIIEDLYRLFDRLEEIEDDFGDFFIKNKHLLRNVEKKEFYEIAYEGMIDWVNSEHSEINTLGLAGISIKTFPLIPVVNLEYKEKEREQTRLMDDIRVLGLQIDEQRKILDDYGKPQWVWGGLAVLVYACFVGIVYPSMLLPYPENIYNDDLTKKFLLILFFSQLVSLIFYLGFAMYKLTNDKEES